jgi:predicted porin
MLRSLAALLAATLVVFSYSAQTIAQSTDQETQARMRILQERIDALDQELKTMKEEQGATAKVVNSSEKKLNTFMKGFFGTMDVSMDYTSKGMNGMLAYGSALAPGVTSPGGPFVYNTSPKVANGLTGPFGRVSWLAAMSSNGSNVGYRGTHQIGSSNVDFIYQVSTSIDMAAAPGLNDTWTKSSNTVTGAIGLGDTYMGFQGHDWGKVKFGEMYMPYKTSTDRLNPFSGMLGNYSDIMGNTGGDNRIEFGTRMDHVIQFNSPTWQGFSFDAAYALGQNPDPNSNLTSLGSVDCSGGNNPGSGNLFLNCDDGGFDNAFSGDLKYETGGLYLVGAYEIHTRVNRSSDGVGANNPYYAYLYGLGPTSTVKCGAVLCSSLLDWSDFLGYEGENPGEALAGSPEYSTAFDVANEWAMKFGVQYTFDFGLTLSYMYEDLHRSVPQILEFQNERQRTGDWLSIEYDMNGGADRIAAGWAHAGASVGDPGGQHNYMPAGIGDNEANMYTVAYWHKLDKQLTFYADFAETANDGNAHYDIGAGGHGIKTDCHDATHALFIDYSSAGPTTWGGCRPIGFSTGINFKF